MFKRFIRFIKGLFSKRTHKDHTVIEEPKPKQKSDGSIPFRLMVMYAGSSIQGIFTQKDVNIIVNKMLAHKNRYINVARQFSMPWEVVAVIHNMEGGLSFKTILHNGERLPIRRTRLVPKGRGPFNDWESAAVDALNMKRRIFPSEWNIGNALDFLEKYNGLGYRKYHKDINTPYLWSGTNMYNKGKYVSDGKYNKYAVSKQIGAVLLLKGLGYGKK